MCRMLSSCAEFCRRVPGAVGRCRWLSPCAIFRCHKLSSGAGCCRHVLGRVVEIQHFRNFASEAVSGGPSGVGVGPGLCFGSQCSHRWAFRNVTESPVEDPEKVWEGPQTPRRTYVTTRLLKSQTYQHHGIDCFLDLDASLALLIAIAVEPIVKVPSSPPSADLGHLDIIPLLSSTALPN